MRMWHAWPWDSTATALLDRALCRLEGPVMYFGMAFPSNDRERPLQNNSRFGKTAQNTTNLPFKIMNAFVESQRIANLHVCISYSQIRFVFT